MQEANKMKSAGIELLVAGVGDVIDFQFLSSLSDKSWPTFNPAIQREIETILDSKKNINNNNKGNRIQTLMQRNCTLIVEKSSSRK